MSEVMDLVIQRETMATTRDEIAKLMIDHDRVLQNDITQKWPLDVDWDLYQKMENADKLRIFTVRDVTSLVGYAVFILGRSQQRKSLRAAHEEVLYIAPDFRGGGAAIDLMEFAECELKKEADIVIYHAPAANPAFGIVLRRRGFKRYAEYFARELSWDV